MVTPGLQISEITSAIDKSIKLVIKLREASKEIERILKSIEHATSVLEQWKHLLEEFGDEVSPTQRKFLKNTAEQYENVLTLLKRFERKHGSLVDGHTGGRFYWVITEHFRNDRAFLEHELSTMEARMSTAINLSSLGQMYKLGRNNSLASTGDGDPTPQTLRQPSNTPVLTNLLEPAAHVTVTTSPLSRLSRPVSPRDAVIAEPETYSSAWSTSTNSTKLSSPSQTNRQVQHLFYADPGDGDDRSVRNEASSESISRQPSLFSEVSPTWSARTSITQYSLDTPPTPFHSKVFGIQFPTWDRFAISPGDEDSPSPTCSLHTSPSIHPVSAASHGSAHQGLNTMVMPDQDWKEDTFPPRYRSQPFAKPQSDAESREYLISAQPPSPDQHSEHLNASKSPQSLRRLSQSNALSESVPALPTPMVLPPPLIEMFMRGEIRIWYTKLDRDENGSVLQTLRNHVVKDIGIVRYDGKGTSEIHMKTADKMTVLHRHSSTIFDLAKTVLRPRVTSDIALRHIGTTCLLRFSGDHTLSARTKDKKWKVFFKGSPEYTFTDDRDNLSFQSRVAGRDLLSEDHVVSITISSSKLPLSENRYLQLWKSPTGHSVRYCCNMDGKNQFREHDVGSLRRCFSKDEVKKKGNWEREVTLKIMGKMGAREKSPRMLKILFPPEVDTSTWVGKAGILMENG